MSARRGWVERLGGGRDASTTEPSGSRPEPGATRPVRSNGPDRSPLPGPGPRARSPVPDPEGPALRVVLVSRDNLLAGALRTLIETPGGVRVLDWYSDELDSAIRHADVVIVDMPPNLHERTFAVIDGRFLGRTVVLLQEGEHGEALPAGPPRAYLYRPLQIGELWTAITGAKPGTVGGDPAADEVEGDAAAAASAEAGPGLPVAESGRLIGLSGQELDPVIGPGQVAPGMDEATFERLRGWGPQGPGRTGPSSGDRRSPAGRAEIRKRARETKAEARRAARAAAGEAKAADTEARRTARAESQKARADARQAAQEQSRQAKAARAEAQTAAREESRQAKAAQAEARAAAQAAAQEQARQAKAAEAEARAAAEAEASQAKAAEAEARAAAQAEARQARRRRRRRGRLPRRSPVRPRRRRRRCGRLPRRRRVRPRRPRPRRGRRLGRRPTGRRRRRGGRLGPRRERPRWPGRRSGERPRP